MCQKCRGIFGLWILNEIIKEMYAENMKKIVGAVLELPVKGQLISKGFFFQFFQQKRTKNVCPSRLGQKFEFTSSFFGRIEDTKKTF